MLGWVEAGLLVTAIYALSLALHVLLPGRSVRGYVCDNEGRALQYKLNGAVVFIVQSLLFRFALPQRLQLVLHDHFLTVVLTANSLGLLASFWFYFNPIVPGGVEPFERAITRDQVEESSGRLKRKSGITQVSEASKRRHPALVFFLGRDWNPRVLGVDVKMWLYLVGAVGLQCNILSCLCYQQQAWGGKTSLAMTVYVAAFGWFLVEYLLGEEVHLYTYDLFAEKIGFKLTWGCLVFYPCFYCIGAFAVAKAEPGEDLSPAQAALTAAVFLAGWVITRGANLQKFYLRTRPDCPTFGFGPLVVRQETLPGTRILVSGWWGVARHFNYLGEILQAVALALPGVLVGPANTYTRWLGVLYPLYYVALFVPRQMDDDAVCAAKYGRATWGEYQRRVPYRIMPGVW